jgi:hypothetical protein
MPHKRSGTQTRRRSKNCGGTGVAMKVSTSFSCCGVRAATRGGPPDGGWRAPHHNAKPERRDKLRTTVSSHAARLQRIDNRKQTVKV